MNIVLSHNDKIVGTPDDKMGLDYNSSVNNRAYKDDIISIIGTTN